MSAHTPGPWSIDYNEGDNILIYSEEGRCLIATVDTENVDDRKVAERDARLIAAAPELLEALEQASDSVDEDYFLKPAVLIKMRAAIAKAKGETS